MQLSGIYAGCLFLCSGKAMFVFALICLAGLGQCVGFVATLVYQVWSDVPNLVTGIKQYQVVRTIRSFIEFTFRNSPFHSLSRAIN